MNWIVPRLVACVGPRGRGGLGSIEESEVQWVARSESSLRSYHLLQPEL